ncbi:sulfotransferase family 2 domain-containing protein [Rhodovulum sulfidophilum]|uniref:sulfotransferase family 2 domain-containing protein n=1 Tax=Rhodovulum sulfidophilum TaxID=35806 RepID=UPI0019224A4A|nr:sulfotransferase family 2 domain-containing protein [Rhodovulum sulfidophilum]MBL3594272.1 sulfotransferase family 2 domain-containing protein [Rhodovulum sulfidophilum]
MSMRSALRRITPLPLRTPLLRRFAPHADPWQPQVLDCRAIFIHVPKTAGSTIKAELYGKPMEGHRRISEFQDFDPKRTAETFKFCFVRNPWDRALSAFSYLKQGKGVSRVDREFTAVHLDEIDNFAAFLAALERPAYRREVMRFIHFRPQIWWTRLPGAAGHSMDFVGRFERVEADMQIVRDRLGLPEQPLGNARSSSHGRYTEAYNSAERDLIAELYAEDVRIFGYAFGG